MTVYQSIAPAFRELAALPQWVCHHHKVPYDPRTGRPARSNDPTTWASYAEAQASLRQHTGRYQGIGFMFCRDYTGLDLDHCVRPDGSIERWARMILERTRTYTEFSPNDGLHLFFRGTIPAGKRRRLSWGAHPQAQWEMYCQGRYFTMTGKQVPGTPGTMTPVDERLLDLVADLDLVERALESPRGKAFRVLWQGDASGYPSPSEADLALCRQLAFWTEHDARRIDRLFRLSGLYRAQKWDRPARAGETYGQGTIARACENIQHNTLRHRPQKQRGHTAVRPSREVCVDGALPEGEELPEIDLAFLLECIKGEEVGDARLYARLFQDRCVYDHTEGAWYEWHGHFWRRDDCQHALLLVSDTLPAVYLQAAARLAEQARTLEEAGREEAIEGKRRKLKAQRAVLLERARRLKVLTRARHVLTYAQAKLPIKTDKWDTHPWKLATPDGVLDLHDGSLHPGVPQDYLRTPIPTHWQGLDAPAPRFAQFLHDIFADRPDTERTELIAFLQRVLGYGLTGLVTEHLFVLLYGEEGRNGKDTLMTILQVVLGSLAGAVSPEVLVASSRLSSPGSATPHLCDLQGKRLAWASETEKGARFAVNKVKYLTGGGAISARQLHGRQYSFTPSHLLLLLTNHKPQADAADAAFWERLCPIVFTMRFVDNPVRPQERLRDPTLGQALQAEASGILAWLVQGCLAWQKQGLALPAEVLRTRQAYREEEDTLSIFLQECCVEQEHAMVRAGLFYERYTAWAAANNLPRLNGRMFGLEVKKRVRSQRTEKGISYLGIGLCADEDT